MRRRNDVAVEHWKAARPAIRERTRCMGSAARCVWRTSIVAITSAFAIHAIDGAAAAQNASPQRGEAGTGVVTERSFDGRIVGPDGEVVSGLEVLLHRVTNQGGAQLARSTTSEDGRFTLRYEPPDAEGVYFVATRYNGRVYVGPMLRAPFTDAGEYVVQVGVPGVGDVEALMQRSTPASPAGSGLTTTQPPTPGAVFVLIMLSAAIVIGVVLTVRGTGPSRRRRALIGLAELDEADPSSESPSTVARRRRGLLRLVREA